jgi:hypothetical protein
MDSLVKVEEAISEGVKAVIELTPAVTFDHVLFSVEKIYVNSEFHIGTDSYRFGFNLIPPAGKEITVAFARKITSPSLEGTITIEELKDQVRKIASAAITYEDQYKNDKQKTSF